MIQFATKRTRVLHESFIDVKRCILPSDRMPSLQDIVEMFTTGRPIDASLERHLEYNELERNPVLQKGFDLADFSRLAKDTKTTIDEINNEIEAKRLEAQSKKEVINNPKIDPPSPVE